MGDSIARNTLFAFASRLSGAIFMAVLTLYLVRALGAAGYGVLALALAVEGLLLLPSDFGVSAAAGRFIAERRGDRNAIARVLADALKLKLITATSASIALFATAGPIASAYDKPDLAWPLRGIALSLFGNSFLLLLGGAFIAQAKASTNFGIDVAKTTIETTASIALVMLGTGVAGAAFGRGAAYLFATGLALALTARYVGRRAVSLTTTSEGWIRNVASYAGALAVVDWAWTFFVQLDALIIGAFLGSEAVGLFRAPLRLLAIVGLLGFAFSASVAPRMVRHEREAPSVDAFVRALQIILVAQAALLAPFVVWAEPLVTLLFGSEYHESADVLRAIAPYFFLSGFAPLVSVSANFLGVARLRPPIVLATLAINVVLSVVLIPTAGIVGAAIAADVAFAVYVPAHLWICRRTVPIPLRPIALSLVRCLLGAAAMSAVLFVAGTSDLSLAEWALGAVVGSAAFAAVLLFSGEITLGGLNAARKEIASRVGIRSAR